MLWCHAKISQGLASLTLAHRRSLLAPRALRLAPLLIATQFLPRLHCETRSQQLFPKILSAIQIGRRAVQLFFIFLPTVVALPLCLIPSLRWLWMRAFAWSIETAGVAWIKLFQFLSHRPDIIGDELAEMMEFLREACPQHSLRHTRLIFRQAYGVELEQMFEEFSPLPIASGSVSQVHTARFQGQKVAVKVRHPRVGDNISLDIAIGLWVTNFLSLFSAAFLVPLREDVLKEMLNDQLDFTKERTHLQVFGKKMRNPNIHFPQPRGEPTEQVLIMEYMDGEPMTHFQAHPGPMNKYIARLAGVAFFEMLIKDNYLHADYHGGNIMVQITDADKSWRASIEHYWQMLKYSVSASALKLLLPNQLLQGLCGDEAREQLCFRKELWEMGKAVHLNLVDVGMVLELATEKRQSFISFLHQLIEGNPNKCAEMIYSISRSGGVVLQPNQHPQYFNDLARVFQFIRGVELSQLQGIQVLQAMLGVIRHHSMKLDGEFATLLSNMLIVEQMTKDLHPDINIMRCIVPFLPYQ